MGTPSTVRRRKLAEKQGTIKIEASDDRSQHPSASPCLGGLGALAAFSRQPQQYCQVSNSFFGVRLPAAPAAPGYPVGPDAGPFMKWRARKTDEEMVNIAGSSDEEYKAGIKREFGSDLNL